MLAGRFKILFLMNLLYLFSYFFLRCALIIYEFSKIDFNLIYLPKTLLVGFIYDASFLVYLNIFFSLILLLIPNILWYNKYFKILCKFIIFISIYAMLFSLVAEVLFWKEFKTRFNFIAVDYLIYTEEVIANIWQSYHIIFILLILLLITITIYLLIRSKVNRYLNIKKNVGSRLFPFILNSLAVIIAFFWVDQNIRENFYTNQIEKEIASNGSYQLFAAFRNNSIDYNSFYLTIPQRKAFDIVKKNVLEDNQKFISPNNMSLERINSFAHPPQRYNFIVITIESLSANYLTRFGNTKNLTPYLDKLISQSIFLDNFYATGTRTVRGLEAVTLSIVPTPGRSIIKRLGNESGWYNIATPLKKLGYQTKFFYGGRAFFDNMDKFYSGNNFQVIDQNNIPVYSKSEGKEIKNFKTAWGYADEYIYDIAMKQAEQNYINKTPFYYHIMTTSNHRPYTYPPNRIDIEAGTTGSREGVLKYTDWALGQFLEKAKTKPWFDNTIFIITSDHTKSSAGKLDIPLSRYHIPLYIYSPANIKPQEIHKVFNQIDIAPTVLGILQQTYTSQFFGKNILNIKDNDKGHAFIGTYQNLGYYNANTNILTVLKPNKKFEQYKVVNDKEILLKQKNQQELDTTIAFYQTASYIFKKHTEKQQKIK